MLRSRRAGSPSIDGVEETQGVIFPSEENVKDAPLSECEESPGGSWSSNAHSICGAARAFSQRTVMTVCLSWLAGMTILMVAVCGFRARERNGTGKRSCVRYISTLRSVEEKDRMSGEACLPEASLGRKNSGW